MLYYSWVSHDGQARLPRAGFTLICSTLGAFLTFQGEAERFLSFFFLFLFFLSLPAAAVFTEPPRHSPDSQRWESTLFTSEIKRAAELWGEAPSENSWREKSCWKNKTKHKSRRRRHRESVPTLCAIKKERKKSFLQACGSFNEEVIQGAFSGGGNGGGDAVQIDVSNLGWGQTERRKWWRLRRELRSTARTALRRISLSGVAIQKRRRRRRREEEMRGRTGDSSVARLLGERMEINGLLRWPADSKEKPCFSIFHLGATSISV